jgi:uncharacterized membrane protein
MCVAQAAEIFGAGIVAGAFLMGSFAVHPAAASLSAPSHVLLRQELIRRLARWMPLFLFLPVFASVGAMIQCRTSVFWSLDALGLALSLATIGITFGVNVPLNRHFAAWSPDALPQDWESYVDRWNVAHSARTMTALTAFICAIYAAM